MLPVRAGLLGVMGAAFAACSGPANSSAPAEPAKSAAPALVEIPRTAGRPVTIDGGMRVLEPFTGDLDVLVERGVVRILVAPSRTHYRVENGVQLGRTVDAAVAFERFLNQKVAPRTVTVMLIEGSESTLVANVIAGQADIAANLLRTFERDDQVAFASPVRSGIREIVVTGPGSPPLVSLEDAGGRAIHVRRHSDHHASLVRLNDQLTKISRPPVKIVLVDDLTDEDLLERVNDGRIPATLADDSVYDAWKAALGKTAANRDVAVSQDGAISWVTRKDSTRLLALINEFFETHRLAF
jgi:membrane-bound lytic murein transglycosylase MltF